MTQDMTVQGLEELMKELSTIKTTIEREEEVREKVIKLSRNITRPSKHAIHALHREEHEKAKELLETARSSIETAHETMEDLWSESVGAFRAGLEEYVEATAYYLFLAEARLPTQEQLGLSFPIPQTTFLLGLCDLPGELARKAVLKAIENDVNGVKQIYAVIEHLFEALMQFDFRTGEYRKKIESVKYQLTKVQDILYDMHMKSSFDTKNNEG